MMEMPIYRGRKPTVCNIDDYRKGLRNQPAEATIEKTDQHKVDLWTVLPAQAMPRQVHERAECILLVINGRGELKLSGRSFDLSKGSLAIVPPGAGHSVLNPGPDPLVVLTVQGPGPFVSEAGESGEGARQT